MITCHLLSSLMIIGTIVALGWHILKDCMEVDIGPKLGGLR